MGYHAAVKEEFYVFYLLTQMLFAQYIHIKSYFSKINQTTELKLTCTHIYVDMYIQKDLKSVIKRPEFSVFTLYSSIMSKIFTTIMNDFCDFQKPFKS